MFFLQAYAVLSVLAGASLVNAHGYVYSWKVNGEVRKGVNPNSSGAYNGAQRPLDNSEANGNGWGPSNRATGQVACGGNSAGSGLATWDLDAGSEVTAQWTGAKNGETGWPTEHHGPALEYMTRCPNDVCDAVPADSLDWFKIGEASWDGSEWPSDKIRRDQDWTFTIPADLASIAYLVRHEQMALHWAWDESTGKGFEVYPHCFQANLKGSGSAVPTDTAKFPDIYSPKNYPMYKFSVANGGKQTWEGESVDGYVPPGPEVYSGGAAPDPAPSSATPSSTASSASSVSTAPIEETSVATEIEPVPTAWESEQTPTESESVSVEEPVVTSAVPDTSSTLTSSAAPSSTSSRTRSRWWWRYHTRAAATTALETSQAEDLQKRNVINRYAVRQFGFAA